MKKILVEIQDDGREIEYVILGETSKIIEIAAVDDHDLPIHFLKEGDRIACIYLDEWEHKWGKWEGEKSHQFYIREVPAVSMYDVEKNARVRIGSRSVSISHSDGCKIKEVVKNAMPLSEVKIEKLRILSEELQKLCEVLELEDSNILKFLADLDFLKYFVVEDGNLWFLYDKRKQPQKYIITPLTRLMLKEEALQSMDAERERREQIAEKIAGCIHSVVCHLE